MLLLLVGDDWAEDHHDVEIMDPLCQAHLRHPPTDN